jgi:hypothetical protein
VAVPSHLRDLAGAVRAAPSGGRTSALAEALADELWVTPRLPGADVTGSPEDAALDRMAVEALAAVAPVDTVRTVAPAAFDPAAQERLEVESVEVEVVRSTRTGGTGGQAARPSAPW